MKLKGRWKEAEVAVNALCEATCKCDSDGITLYFFSSHSKTTKGECPYFRKYEAVASGADVMKQFANPDNAPHGGTDLTAVLEDALPEDRGTKPKSLLIITDGCPDDPKSTEDFIIKTVNNLNDVSELSITIIQVGDDAGGNGYLESLDTALESRGAKFDCVEAISNAALNACFVGKTYSFSAIVKEAIVVAAKATPDVPQTTKPKDGTDCNCAAEKAQIKALEEALEQKTKDMNSYSGEMEAVVAGLEAERNELKKKLAEAVANGSAAKIPDDYEALKTSESEKTAQIITLNAKIEKLEKTIGGLNGKQSQEESELLTYSKQIDDLSQKLKNARLETDKFKTTIATKDTEVSSLQVSNKELLNLSTEQKAMIEKQGKDLMDSLKAKREYEGKIATLEHELADAKDNTARLANEFDQYRESTTKALKDKATSAEEALTKHISELENTIAEKSKAYDECSAELTKAKGELKAAQTTIEGLNRDHGVGGIMESKVETTTTTTTTTNATTVEKETPPASPSSWFFSTETPEQIAAREKAEAEAAAKAKAEAEAAAKKAEEEAAAAKKKAEEEAAAAKKKAEEEAAEAERLKKEAEAKAKAIEERKLAEQHLAELAAQHVEKTSKVVVVEKTEEEALEHIKAHKESVDFDELNPPKRFGSFTKTKTTTTVEKTTKGPPFDISTLKTSGEKSKAEKAAINIQRVYRGYLTRKKSHKLLHMIPHVVNVKVEYATDLPANNDMMGSKPDIFVLINTFSKKNLKKGRVLHCDSTNKSRTIVANQNPVFEEEFTSSAVGSGKIVLNVMSEHTLWAPTLVGQAIIEQKKYWDLLAGKPKKFLIPLQQKKEPIYDQTGTEMAVADAPQPVTGFICVSVAIPTIYHNMCGWFWDIHDYFNGFGAWDTTGSKIWVVVKDKIIYVYDNPYDNKLKKTINTTDVLGMEMTTYDKLEIEVEGVKLLIEIGPENARRRSEILWAWGDDSSKIKGLWKRALIAHHQAPSVLNEEVEVSKSVKVIASKQKEAK